MPNQPINTPTDTLKTYPSAMLQWVIPKYQSQITKSSLENTPPNSRQEKSVLTHVAELGQTEMVSLLLRTINPDLVIKRGLEKEIECFFLRLEKRAETLRQSKQVSNKLSPFITQADLLKTYCKVLTDEDFKNQVEASLKIGAPIRLAKEQSGLPYTFNIIFDPETQEVVLLLETKSKILSPENKATIIKNPSVEIFSGSYKTVKAAYRIDTLHPQKWANAVYYAENKNDLDEMQEEEAVSRNTAKNKPSTFINRIIAGSIIDKVGIRAEKNTPFKQKQSVYSKWANCGSLRSFIQNTHQNLTDRQKGLLTKQLLTAVYTLHKENIIHQDIKSENILVFKDTNGNYHLELADFGLAYDPQFSKNNDIACATLQYESPEISAFNRLETAYYHKDFHNKEFTSHGRDMATSLASEPSYKLPNKANDMWSVGIVLHEIYHGDLPDAESISKLPDAPVSDLIKNLLHPIRSHRLTAEAATTHPSMQSISTSINPIMAQILLEDINKALLRAIDNNHPETVEELICAGACIAPQHLNKAIGAGKDPKIQNVIEMQLFLAEWGSLELIKEKYFTNCTISFPQRSCIFKRRPPLSEWQEKQLRSLAQAINGFPPIPEKKDILKVFDKIEQIEVALGNKYTYSDPKLKILLSALHKSLKTSCKLSTLSTMNRCRK